MRAKYEYQLMSGVINLIITRKQFETQRKQLKGFIGNCNEMKLKNGTLMISAYTETQGAIYLFKRKAETK